MKTIEKFTPTKAFERFLVWFDSNKRLVFFSAMIAGLITHLLMIVKGYMSPDGLVYANAFSSGGFDYMLGRWGLNTLDSIRGNLSLNALISIFSIFWTSVGAMFVADAFQLKKKFTCILAGITVVVFPTLIVTMLYEYCADAYMLAFALSAAALWIYNKVKSRPARIIGFLVCMVLSLGMYQSGLGLLLGGELILIILELLKGEEKLLSTVWKGVRYLILAAVGMVCYTLMTRFMCATAGVEMGGMYGVGAFGISDYIENFGSIMNHVYGQFFRFYLRDDIVYNTAWHRHQFYEVMFLMMAVLILASIIRRKLYRDIPRTILIIVGVVLIPLGINAVFFVQPTGQLYALNGISLVSVIFFFYTLLEDDFVELADRAGIFEKITVLMQSAAKWIGTAAALCVVLTYFMANMASYAMLDATYNQLESLTTRILDRIETTEGYKRGMPILFTDIVTNEQFPVNVAYRPYTIDSLTCAKPFHPLELGGYADWTNYFLLYQGESIVFCDLDLMPEIQATEEYQEMNAFPAQNSVKVINDVMVVKMSEDE